MPSDDAPDMPPMMSQTCPRSECGIRENLDTNEYPNIFESKNLHEQIFKYICINKFDTNECPNKYSPWKLYIYSNIFEYSSSSYTLTHWRTNVRIYSYKQIWCRNIFIKEKLIQRNVRIYICDQYIRIFKYSNIFATLCPRWCPDMPLTCSRWCHRHAPDDAPDYAPDIPQMMSQTCPKWCPRPAPDMPFFCRFFLEICFRLFWHKQIYGSRDIAMWWVLWCTSRRSRSRNSSSWMQCNFHMAEPPMGFFMGRATHAHCPTLYVLALLFPLLMPFFWNYFLFSEPFLF